MTLPEIELSPLSGEDKRPKSMRSRDNRLEYAKKALQKEWAAMGSAVGGMSQHTATVIDLTV